MSSYLFLGDGGQFPSSLCFCRRHERSCVDLSSLFSFFISRSPLDQLPYSIRRTQLNRHLPSVHGLADFVQYRRRRRRRISAYVTLALLAYVTLAHKLAVV